MEGATHTPPNAGDQETEFHGGETVAFLPKAGKDPEAQSIASDVKVTDKAREDHDHDDADKFYGLTREELEQYSSDPHWVKIRRILFGILVVCWVAMLVTAIIFVVVAPKCPPVPPMEWYEDGIAYKLSVEKFQDSNDDGNGDLEGIDSRVSHFQELSVASVWVGDVMDSNDKFDVNSTIGTMENFEQLAAKLKKKGVRIVIDLNLDDGSLMDSANELVRSWAVAGAEGFVFSRPNGTSDAEYAEKATALQEVLEELNKKDDRARAIICNADGINVDALSDVKAVVYNPQTNCSMNYTCVLAVFDALGSSTLKKPWKIPEIEIDFEDASSKLAFKLTVAGTPNIIYGDEIGLGSTIASRGYMKWDDSDSGGFTSKQGWTLPAQQDQVQSVLAQRSLGFSETSYYALFKQMAALRKEEPALKWGNFKFLDVDADIVSYIREAEGFPPIVVAFSPSEPKAISLAYGDYTKAEVLFAGGVDLTVGEAVELNAIYMPKSAVLVMKMMDPKGKLFNSK